MIDPQTTAEMVGTYIGWEELEKQLSTQSRTEREKIIDFYLIDPRKGKEFTLRPQVLEVLEDLYNRVEPANNEEEFVKAKLKASMSFISALIGEVIPFSDYVKNTTGLTPQMIPEEVIQKQKEIMNARMREVGYRPESESFETFYKRIIISKQEALRQLNTIKRTVPPLVQRALGFDDLKIDYVIKDVEERDFWGAWTSKEPGEPFLLRFNFQPMIHWRKGDMGRISKHEYTHFIHGQNLMDGISRGEINPFIGLTTVHDPHTFSGEGAATAILYHPEVEKRLSKYELLSRDRVALIHYLTSNAVILMNQGKGDEELIEYFRDCPFMTRERLLDSFVRWKIPSRRAYEYVYGSSLLTHLQMLGRLSTEKQTMYLRHALTRYEMPERLIGFAERLFSN